MENTIFRIYLHWVIDQQWICYGRYTLINKPTSFTTADELRRRRHDRTLTSNDDKRNFVYRQIHKDSY